MSANPAQKATPQEHGESPPMPLKARKLLMAMRLSQRALAPDLGLTHASISRWLSGVSQPDRTPGVKERLEACLRRHGADEADIAEALEIDDGLYQPRTTRQGFPLTGQAAAPIAEDDQLPEIEMLSQSARRHFKLFRDPFQDDVQSADDVFLSEEHRYVREAMFSTSLYGGFLAVVGESGAGKTVLRRDLIERIRREDHAITAITPRTVDKERLTAGAICDAVIADVSQERPRRSLEAKARQIERLLTGSSRAGNHHVLIIEEAHDLTVSTLKYLKRFWELEDGFRKLLAIILIGQPELKAKLNERQNWEAREVIRRCEVAELQPLGDDLKGYLALKLARLQKAAEEVFAADAFEAIRARLTLRARGGSQSVQMDYPLVVNNLVVRCMNLAAEVGSPRVTAEIVHNV